MALDHESIDEMRADESGAARHQYALLILERKEFHLLIGLFASISIFFVLITIPLLERERKLNRKN